MKREEITALARKAGFTKEDHYAIDSMLARFGALVASAEREACAQACDAEATRLGNGSPRRQHRHGASLGALICARTLRARGKA